MHGNPHRFPFAIAAFKKDKDKRNKQHIPEISLLWPSRVGDTTDPVRAQDPFKNAAPGHCAGSGNDERRDERTEKLLPGD
jgi:hypothetical protein